MDVCCSVKFCQSLSLFYCHIAIQFFAKTLAQRLAVVDCKHGSKPVDVF